MNIVVFAGNKIYNVHINTEGIRIKLLWIGGRSDAELLRPAPFDVGQPAQLRPARFNSGYKQSLVLQEEKYQSIDVSKWFKARLIWQSY